MAAWLSGCQAVGRSIWGIMLPGSGVSLYDQEVIRYGCMWCRTDRVLTNGGPYMRWGVGLCYGSYFILQILKAKWIFNKKLESWLFICWVNYSWYWCHWCGHQFVDICLSIEEDREDSDDSKVMFTMFRHIWQALVEAIGTSIKTLVVIFPLAQQ